MLRLARLNYGGRDFLVRRVATLVGLGLLTVAAACSAPVSSAVHQRPVVQALVREVQVTIRAPAYQVTVTPTGHAWIEAGRGKVLSPPPLFSGVVKPGQAHSFDSTGGQIWLLLASDQVRVTVRVNQSHTPAWRYVPMGSPETILFASST
jgi:hypothetical protein